MGGRCARRRSNALDEISRDSIAATDLNEGAIPDRVVPSSYTDEVLGESRWGTVLADVQCRYVLGFPTQCVTSLVPRDPCGLETLRRLSCLNRRNSPRFASHCPSSNNVFIHEQVSFYYPRPSMALLIMHWHCVARKPLALMLQHPIDGAAAGA